MLTCVVFFILLISVFLVTANKVKKLKSETECVDDKHACVMWAKHGYCERRPDIMHIKCKKSCRICSKCMHMRELYGTLSNLEFGGGG